MRTKRIITVLALLLAGTAGVLSASEPIVLTEESAVRKALEQNLSLRSTRIDLDTAESRDRNRWNSLLPDFSATAGVSRTDNWLSDETPATTGDPWGFSASLGASLPLSYTTALSMNSATLGYESQALQYETEEKMLTLNVKKQFYYLLAYRENLVLQEKNIELAEKRYEQSLVNYRNGLASELSLLQAQNSLESLKPALTDTRTTYNTLLMAFKNMLGIDLDQPIELEGELSVDYYDLDASVLVDTYLAGRMDIQSYQKNIDIQENRLAMTKSTGLTPSLNLSAQWNNSLAALSSDPAWGDTAVLSVSMSIPVNGFIPGSSKNLDINEAEQSVEKAKLSLQDGMDSAEEEIRKLLMQLEGARENIETTELSVELALKTYEMTESAYNQGTSELLDVEDAQNKLLSGNLDLLMGRYSYLSGLLDLEYALNTAMSDIVSVN